MRVGTIILTRIILSGTLGTGLAVSSGAAHAGPEVWLDEGQVILTLPSGKEVTVEAGNYADCDEEADECEIVPLALAPARPELLTLAQGAQLTGAVAQAPLLGPGTILPTVAGPAVGIGAVVAGVVVGLTAASDTTPAVSTTGQ
ncbi:MAG: hypothetical protein AAGI70_07015 [Pseudomonadota bacterium]